MKHSRRDLNKLLDRHINPEKSREFNQDHWKKSRDFLAELAKEKWLRNDAKIIHVVGSNGKGSTAHYLNELAKASNEFKNIGLYTSPHLITVTERIKINSIPTSFEDAISGLVQIEKNIGTTSFNNLSYFEVLTILALYIFKKKNCKLIILEVGLGGRLDATRMAAGHTIVLTKLNMEHSELLGNTLEKITYEKLGIVTPNTKNIFILEDLSHSDYKKLIKSNIAKIQTDITNADTIKTEYFRAKKNQNYLQENFHYAKFILNNLFNIKNANIDFNSINQLAARMEIKKINVISKKDENNFPSEQYIIFDTAHNPDAILRVLQDIQQLDFFPGLNHSTILIGLLKDKNIKLCIKAIKDSGFNNVFILQDKLYNNMNEKEIPQIKKNLISQYFHIHLKNNKKSKCIVFLGSHRHYPEYIQLTSTRINNET